MGSQRLTVIFQPRILTLVCTGRGGMCGIWGDEKAPSLDQKSLASAHRATPNPRAAASWRRGHGGSGEGEALGLPPQQVSGGLDAQFPLWHCVSPARLLPAGREPLEGSDRDGAEPL